MTVRSGFPAIKSQWPWVVLHDIEDKGLTVKTTAEEFGVNCCGLVLRSHSDTLLPVPPRLRGRMWCSRHGPRTVSG